MIKNILIIGLLITGFIFWQYSPSRNQFGAAGENLINTTIHTSLVGVSSASSALLPARGGRAWFRCTNLSVPTKSVNLFLGATASKSWGIYLEASKSFEMGPNPVWQGPVSAIIADDVASKTTRVSCIEGY